MSNAKDDKAKKSTRSIGRFFKDMAGELKRVVWPSRNQVINNSGIVIAFMVLAAVVVSALDFGIVFLLKLIFGSGF